MQLARTIALRMVVPAVIAVYLALFWYAVSDMDIGAYYPRALIVVIGLLLAVISAQSVLFAFTAARRSDEAAQADAPPRRTVRQLWAEWRYVAYIVAAVLAFVQVMSWVGIYVGTVVFMVGLTLALGYRRPVVLLLWGAGGYLIVSVFVRLFRLPLPGAV